MAPPEPPQPDVAKVKQTAFSTSPNTPNEGNFTCHVTLKNVGKVKATHIQVMVSPFRGITRG